MTIGWEQNVTRVNESQLILKLCVVIFNLDVTAKFPGFRVCLATNTSRGILIHNIYVTTSLHFSFPTDVIIGWEQNVTSVNERQLLLELCVRVLNLDDDVEFPGFGVCLAANTIRGTAAGELCQEFS